MTLQEVQARRAAMMPRIERLLAAMAGWRRDHMLQVMYSRAQDGPAGASTLPPELVAQLEARETMGAARQTRAVNGEKVAKPVGSALFDPAPAPLTDEQLEEAGLPNPKPGGRWRLGG